MKKLGLVLVLSFLAACTPNKDRASDPKPGETPDLQVNLEAATAGTDLQASNDALNIAGQLDFGDIYVCYSGSHPSSFCSNTGGGIPASSYGNTKVIQVVNNTSSSKVITSSLTGAVGTPFQIVTDRCSGATLGAGEGCKIYLRALVRNISDYASNVPQATLAISAPSASPLNILIKANTLAGSPNIPLSGKWKISAAILDPDQNITVAEQADDGTFFAIAKQWYKDVAGIDTPSNISIRKRPTFRTVRITNVSNQRVAGSLIVPILDRNDMKVRTNRCLDVDFLMPNKSCDITVSWLGWRNSAYSQIPAVSLAVRQSEAVEEQGISVNMFTGDINYQVVINRMLKPNAAGLTASGSDTILNDLVSIGTGDGLSLPSAMNVATLDTVGAIVEDPSIAPVLRVKDVSTFAAESTSFAGIPSLSISALPLSSGLVLITFYPSDMLSLDPFYTMHEPKSYTVNLDAPSLTMTDISSLNGIGWTLGTGAKEFAPGKVVMLGFSREADMDYSSTQHQSKMSLLKVDFTTGGTVTVLEDSLSSYTVTEETPAITYHNGLNYSHNILAISSVGALIQTDHTADYYHGGPLGSYYPATSKSRLLHVNLATDVVTQLSNDLYEAADPLQSSTVGIDLFKQVDNKVVIRLPSINPGADPGREKLNIVDLSTGVMSTLDDHARPFAFLTNNIGNQVITNLVKIDTSTSDLFLLKHIKNSSDNFATWDLKKVDMVTGTLSTVKANIAPLASNFSALLSGPITNISRNKFIMSFGTGRGDQILVKTDLSLAGTSILYTSGANEYIYNLVKISPSDKLVSMIEDTTYSRISSDVMSMNYANGTFIRLIRGSSMDDTTSTYTSVSVAGHASSQYMVIGFNKPSGSSLFYGHDGSGNTFGPLGVAGYSQTSLNSIYSVTDGMNGQPRWYIYGQVDTTNVENPLTKPSRYSILDLASGTTSNLPVTGDLTGENPISGVSLNWEHYAMQDPVYEVSGGTKHFMFIYHPTNQNDTFQFWYSSQQ